jgi:flagellar protein FlaG
MSSLSSIAGMGSNLTSGTGSISGTDRSQSTSVVTQIQPVQQSISRDDQPIQTTQELKQAELQGKAINPGETQLIKAIEHANKAMLGATTTFEFAIHDKTKQIMVKVIDKDTGEIIREIPPEKTLDMVAKMWELAGIIVDKKV